MMTKHVKEMTIDEVISEEVSHGEVALNMGSIVANSLSVSNKEEVQIEITAIMYDVVGDPFNDENIVYDLKALIGLANMVEV